MKIIGVALLEGDRDVVFPGPYLEAWAEPDLGSRMDFFRVSLIRIDTDEGIVGYGPHSGGLDEGVRKALIGRDPLKIGQFWYDYMDWHGESVDRSSYGGIYIALWDIAGKAAGLPISVMLGAKNDKMPVYAATTRLQDKEAQVETVLQLQSEGFRAVKLRMHRQNFRDDLVVMEAASRACPDLFLMVDANQNNFARGYNYWDMETSSLVARELQAMGFALLEEPRPRNDVEGLAKLAAENDILIAGGEHSPNIHAFSDHIKCNAYDVLQPDPIIGDFGISGLQKLGTISEYLGKQFMPHVCSLGSFALSFAAALHVVSNFPNCPYLEFPHDPPFVTIQSQQFYINQQFKPDKDGCVKLPLAPGLGLEVYEDAIFER